MDQDKQTLLEAAKEMDRLCMFTGTSALASRVVANLRAAIAREEAKQDENSLLHPLQWWIEEGRKRLDRAQQAEADAKWHREESARLSAELAKERERTVSTATSWRRQVDQVREEAEAAPDEPTIDAITSLRQRAEKAEAELAKLIDMKVNPVVFAPEPTKVEMQTHAFGSNAVGGKPSCDDDDEDPVDPQTGWTFATYRRVVEALVGKS